MWKSIWSNIEIGKDYLKEPRNTGTDNIITSITQALVHLVTACGMVDSDVLDR